MMTQYEEQLPTKPVYHEKRDEPLIKTPSEPDLFATLEVNRESLHQSASNNVNQTVEVKAASVSPFKQAVKTALTAPGVWAGSGGSILCIGSSTLGLLGFGALTLLSLRNEIVASTSIRSKAENQANPSPNTKSVGLSGLIREIAQSPGANLSVNGAIWVGSAVETLIKGDLFMSGIFAVSAIGSLAAASVVNKGWPGIERSTTLVETVMQKLWNKAPQNLRTILSNPAPWYCGGNIVLVSHQTGLAAMMQPSLSQAALLSGILCSALGVINGVLPAFSKSLDPRPEGKASYYNALGNASFAIASFLSGGYAVSVANAFWGVSNYLLGRKLERARKGV